MEKHTTAALKHGITLLHSADDLVIEPVFSCELYSDFEWFVSENLRNSGKAL